MQVVTLCVLAAALAGQATGGLLPPERPYKILMLLPVASKSHRNVFLPLAEALADRGHEIVMLTNLPPASKNPNIMEINHDLPYMGGTTQNMFDKGEKSGRCLGDFKYILPLIAKELYKVPAVKKLYDKRKEFDLIVVNHIFNEIAYPFVHEVPFITVATPGMDHSQSAAYGNVLNPSYAPTIMVTFPLPMSLWHRLKNTFMHLYVPFFWRTWDVVPAVQKEISAQFPDLPPLLELERNQSLTLMNTHFSIDNPVPLLPSQVEVGAMHCRPAKPLPKDLESWLDGAGSAGVIYFSLGSIARSETMPPEYRQAFLEAFRRLPQRVLWKYEGELEGVSDNVRISSWLPQQDVLAHDSVKVFISHGGLLSLQESIFHATPLLVLPIFGDQPKNAMFVENSGLGRMLVWEELTADSIVDALTDIITKPNHAASEWASSLVNSCHTAEVDFKRITGHPGVRYKENVARMSASLKDQLTTPQERAVFWTEYVIRHRGAPQLRCPGAQLSWVQFLMLDVVGLLLAALLLLVFILRRLVKTVSAILFGNTAKTKKE